MLINMVKKTRIMLFFMFFAITTIISDLNAQAVFPNTDFWSLDAGIGMTDILVKGFSLQAIIDPKFSITPRSMVGAKFGIGYSWEKKDAANNLSNIFSLDALVYYRFNLFRIRNPENTTNIFIQGGLGLMAAYRGNKNPFDNDKLTRGSGMIEASAGVTIPFNERWHIEPQISTGYPHLFEISATAGYKFRLRRTITQYETVTEVVEVIKEVIVEQVPQQEEIVQTPQMPQQQPLPPDERIVQVPTPSQEERIRQMPIYGREFILFGPNIGRYNEGIDRDAQGLNELVLNYIAQTLNDNPNLKVRIEGHANPVTTDPAEADELLALSTMRANNVAAQLRGKGVKDSQMIISAFGGTRTVTRDHGIWNRNRRVELILVEEE